MKMGSLVGGLDMAICNSFRLTPLTHRHRHCGEEPKIIIMDATSLAFRKNLDAWQTLKLVQSNEKQKLRMGR